jgi:alcohol dehydrogenase
VVRALVLEEPRRLVERAFPRPMIGEDDGLVRVEACGLCGTDHEQYSGELFGGFPFVPGHETVGVLEEVGARAAKRWGVRAGDRVAVEVFQSCRDCDECRAGRYRRCVKHGLRDMYGFIPVERAPSLWGGYAEYQYLGPDAMVLRVPDGLDPVTATLFNPLGAGIRWGVTLPGTQAGDVVAILGPGVRGLAALVAMRAAGAEFVLVTGHGPGDEPRLALARELGADRAIDVESEDPVAVLRSSAGRLADVVVDVTAKAPAALGQAVALARPGGTVVLAGTRGASETPGFVPDLIVYKELRILGALGVDVGAYGQALAQLGAGTAYAQLPHQVAGLGQAATLLEAMAGDGPAVPPVHGVINPSA